LVRPLLVGRISRVQHMCRHNGVHAVSQVLFDALPGAYVTEAGEFHNADLPGLAVASPPVTGFITLGRLATSNSVTRPNRVRLRHPRSCRSPSYDSVTWWEFAAAVRPRYGTNSWRLTTIPTTNDKAALMIASPFTAIIISAPGDTCSLMGLIG